MQKLEIEADPRKRVSKLMRDYMAAPPDADIEVRIGCTPNRKEGAVILDINGTRHGFTSMEARMAAEAVESALHAHPNEDGAEGLPNLILALRAGADKADQAIV